MHFNFSRYKSIWVLIAINTLMFIVTTIRPDIGDSLALTKPFLNSNYWTILTAMFVHANFLHIFGNMLTLYFFGIFCLQLIDDKWFWIVYFIGGIFGNILFLLIGPANSAVVGASGAIFAIGGLIAMMRPNQKVYAIFRNTDAALGGYRHRFWAYCDHSRSRLAGPPWRTDCRTYRRFLLPPAGTAEIASGILPFLIRNLYLAKTTSLE